MQSLAAFTGADFRSPGALDYVNFLRATHMCTNDVREKARAFERAVFNVAFNNRDDHPKNFAYLMSRTGEWTLAPAYDVTFCEGPGGYHQMDVMGEALDIGRKEMLALAGEAEIPQAVASELIDRICAVARQFTEQAQRSYPGMITQETLQTVQSRRGKCCVTWLTNTIKSHGTQGGSVAQSRYPLVVIFIRTSP